MSLRKSVSPSPTKRNVSPSKPHASPSKPNPKDRPRRASAVEIERVLDARGMAPLAEKALTIGEEIGKGKFKKVYTGLLRQQCGGARREVVVMQYKKQGSEVNEVSVLALLAGHARGKTFVPQVFGVVDQNSMISVVQEQAAHGTLKSVLQSADVLQFTPQHKVNAAMNVVFALEYLQSLRIIHADLACRNLLLFHLDNDPSTISVKVTDFGLALVIAENSTGEIKKQPQATRWCAPETVASNKYSFYSDMWSLGVTLWELFADGANPWSCCEKRAEVTSMLTELARQGDTSSSAHVVSANFPLPDTCPCDAREVIMSCLMLDEESRPTAAEAAGRLRVLSHVESTLELSAVSQDDVESIFSTEASGGIRGCSASCENLPMKLVRDLSSKLLENEKPQSISTPAPDHSITTKLQVVTDFLWSPHARIVLGDAQVQKMQQEVAEAQEALRSYRGRSPLRSGQQQSVPRFEQQDTVPLRELFLPVVQKQGHARCWPSTAPLSIWTLWSLLENDVLHRADFGSEAAARAALQAGVARSFVLRGPNNEEEIYAPCIRSGSPCLRSGSPVVRSGSPGLRSGSAILRSPSPVLRSASPVLRSSSPYLQPRVV